MLPELIVSVLAVGLVLYSLFFLIVLNLGLLPTPEYGHWAARLLFLRRVKLDDAASAGASLRMFASVPESLTKTRAWELGRVTAFQGVRSGPVIGIEHSPLVDESGSAPLALWQGTPQ